VKVIVQAETEEEKTQIPDALVFDNCVDFVVCGRKLNAFGAEESFSHRHIADRCWLIGKLFETIERIRND